MKHFYIGITLLILLGCKTEPLVITNTVEKLVPYEKVVVVEKLKFKIFDITGTGLNDLIRVSQYADTEVYTSIMDALLTEIGSTEVRDSIIKYSLEYNVPVLLAVSLAWQESKYNAEAINYNRSSVDYGLFQLNSETFNEYTPEEIYSLDVNVKEAMTFLNYLILRFESWDLALVAYNAGPSAVVNQRVPWTTFKHVTTINSKIATLERQLAHALMASMDVES